MSCPSRAVSGFCLDRLKWGGGAQSAALTPPSPPPLAGARRSRPHGCNMGAPAASRARADPAGGAAARGGRGGRDGCGRDCLGKMEPNWAKCLKSGQNFSRSGQKKIIHQDSKTAGRLYTYGRWFVKEIGCPGGSSGGSNCKFLLLHLFDSDLKDS